MLLIFIYHLFNQLKVNRQIRQDFFLSAYNIYLYFYALKVNESRQMIEDLYNI